MGLSYTEVRKLTPRELFIRMEGIERQTEIERYNTALVCTFVHNSAYNNNPNIRNKKKTDLLKPEDIFKFKYIGKPKNIEKQDWHLMKDNFKGLVSGLGGKINGR